MPGGKDVTSVKIVKSHKIPDWCDWGAGADWASLKPQTFQDMKPHFPFGEVLQLGYSWG
jgi:hypothetical protein